MDGSSHEDLDGKSQTLRVSWRRCASKGASRRRLRRRRIWKGHASNVRGCFVSVRERIEYGEWRNGELLANSVKTSLIAMILCRTRTLNVAYSSLPRQTAHCPLTPCSREYNYSMHDLARCALHLILLHLKRESERGFEGAHVTPRAMWYSYRETKIYVDQISRAVFDRLRKTGWRRMSGVMARRDRQGAKQIRLGHSRGEKHELGPARKRTVIPTR